MNSIAELDGFAAQSSIAPVRRGLTEPYNSCLLAA
jgi:hypothetical protein